MLYTPPLSAFAAALASSAPHHLSGANRVGEIRWKPRRSKPAPPAIEHMTCKANDGRRPAGGWLRLRRHRWDQGWGWGGSRCQRSGTRSGSGSGSRGATATGSAIRPRGDGGTCRPTLTVSISVSVSSAFVGCCRSGAQQRGRH